MYNTGLLVISVTLNVYWYTFSYSSLFLQMGWGVGVGDVGGPVCKHYVNVNIPGKGKKE